MSKESQSIEFICFGLTLHGPKMNKLLSIISWYRVASAAGAHTLPNGCVLPPIVAVQGLTAIKNKLLAFAVQRKAQFEDGEPFHFHKLATAEEATVLVAAAENEVADCGAEVSVLAACACTVMVGRGALRIVTCCECAMIFKIQSMPLVSTHAFVVSSVHPLH